MRSQLSHFAMSSGVLYPREMTCLLILLLFALLESSVSCYICCSAQVVSSPWHHIDVILCMYIWLKWSSTEFWEICTNSRHLHILLATHSRIVICGTAQLMVLRHVGRLRGLVRSKLGFAFGSGPDLAALNSPSGASPVQQAQLASTSQASFSGRSDRACKVRL